MRRDYVGWVFIWGIPFLLHILPASSFAQITFERTYGGTELDVARCVRQASDGGYVIAGYTESFGAAGKDVYSIKVDSLGNTLWGMTYGGTSDDMGYCVRQTLDGGYIIVGETESFGAGWEDVYLIKTDTNGNTVWDSTYGDFSHDMGYSVEQTFDKGYVIVGATRSFTGGWYNVYLIKTDSLGQTFWMMNYGGIDGDYGYSVHQTPDSGYIIGGESESFSAGLFDFRIIKTDSLGLVHWEKSYGGTSHDRGRCLQQTLDGGYIIVGETYSFGVGGDVYVIKTDSLGDVLWDTTYGGSSIDVGHYIQQTADGGYVIVGKTGSFGAGGDDVYLIKTNSLGSVLWERTYGGSFDDIGYSIQQTADGGYVIAGYKESFGGGEADVYLIKTDQDGLVGLEEKSPRFNAEGSRVEMSQNKPNPFHRLTTIQYMLPMTHHITLEVYDLAGRLAEILVDESQEPGVYRVEWNGSKYSNGIYFYRLEAGGFTDTRKMILLR